MAERTAWGTLTLSHDLPRGKETIKELSKPWKTISNTNAALRRLEEQLDVGLATYTMLDPIMETKKPPSSSTRKISRKDGRIPDSSNNYISKSSNPSKPGGETLSRSPLRATTLESNVKKSSHVMFREPLASYRDAASSLSTTKTSAFNVGASEEREFDSTRSSAVDDTSVRYLNDQPAIDALDWRLPPPHTDAFETAVHADYGRLRLPDASQQSLSFSPSSNRLEALRRRQPDPKLEKLKERIRRQWELSGERHAREWIPNNANSTEPVGNVKTRKVTSAPPPPVYPGFNPPETKVRTPDGKLFQEEEFHNVPAHLHGSFLPNGQEDASASDDKSRAKRSSRPVRKVQRLPGAVGTASPENKTGDYIRFETSFKEHSTKRNIISTSSWRDGQKLVKQILGPAPTAEKRSKNMPTDGHDGQLDRKQTCSDREVRKRPVSTERPRERRPKSSDRQSVKRKQSKESQEEDQDRSSKSATSILQHNIDKSRDSVGNTVSHGLLAENQPQVVSAEVKTDFLPLEIRGILDDLQLDSGVELAKQTRSHSPSKRKSEKAQVQDESHIAKKRHYDTEQVRQYILRQQEERKRKQKEQKEAQRQSEEQKNKRLQELYQKQKEAFSKARSVTSEQRETTELLLNRSVEPSTPLPQDMHPTLLLRPAWPDVTAQEKQVKPLYQPSGESDKENKGQERPPSASSSSDMSLSEPLQPLFRSDLVDTCCLQPDRLISKAPLPQSPSAGGTGLLSQLFALPRDVESFINLRKKNASAESQRKDVQGKISSNFKSNLDRIESLKATAASLSTRIENEAKKLAGGSLALQPTWSTDLELKQEIKTAWKKPDSPPEREDGEDFFSARIQNMLGTCTTNFSQRDLPGANHLYKKHPEEFRHTVASTEKCEVKEGERSATQRERESEHNHHMPDKTSPSQNSSTSSISEGPLLSEGSLSEGEEVPPLGVPPFPSADMLKSSEFCIRDTNSYVPLVEFQREASKYPPLSSANICPQMNGPWEELAKGSPHSVINIFAKSYHLFGKGLEEQSENGSPELQPLYGPASSQDSISYADDFISPPVSESTSENLKVQQQSINSIALSIKEELPVLVKSKSDVASSHSSGSRSCASSPASSSSQRASKHWKKQNSSSQNILEQEHNSSGSERRLQARKPSQRTSPPGKDRSAGSDASGSTIGELSPRSISSVLSDAERSLRSQHSSINDPGVQVPAGPSITAGLGTQAPGVTGPEQGDMRFPPSVLHQRMSTELNYLSAMEESMRQLCDVERARGISLAQQDTISLAQILKAQQQRHEHNMTALRQQAEQEAQASLRQLEEARQKVAQAEAEMLQRFQKTMETTTSQRTHRYQEDMNRASTSPPSSDPTFSSLVDHPKRTRQHGTRKKESHSASSSQSSGSPSSFREPPQSEQDSTPAPIVEAIVSHSEVDESISEELPSLSRSALDEKSVSIENKGTSSADPVSEGIEEQSFRSLLPSEAHRRDSLERQRSLRHESDEESTPDKELSGPFSSGQDSFWRFTMEMVRQYMQEGEMRSTHQAALLRLRQKALKDKTKAELAWLEHQKRRLRDKGEDDKMPPLRKRQRGLLLRLQQEQAEIKRLQEANKAARRERQLILKQQEEIQRIQNSTLRLQEKLKSAENGQLEIPSEVDAQPSPASSRLPSDAESRSPSPVSVSGSETSSIMQKLRKMHSHMDAKFLTKREQQLVQRRLHAQELLEWKKRLDAEEIEIRRIEKQALAAWDDQKVKTKSQSPEHLNTAEEKVSVEGSPVSPSTTTPPKSPTSAYVPSENIEYSSIAEQLEEQSEDHSSISEEMVPSLHSKGSAQKSCKDPESGKDSSKTMSQQAHITLRPHQLSKTWSEESLSVAHSETTSDQSDIECRIRALKEELRKRKSVVDNLKREQKRRHKERLKAQEAILLKQLQSYDEFILKTQAELNREQGPGPSVKHSDQTRVESREPAVLISESTHRVAGTATFDSEKENDHHAELRIQSEGSFTQEKSQNRSKESEERSYSKSSVQGHAPLSSKEIIIDTQQPRTPSPLHREHMPLSTHSSPVSSIHSEIPEEMLETHSHFSTSPPPPLSLNLKSPTPEESLSPERDHSYSDDFEASVPIKTSISETPREEIEFSYATTPGRDLPSEGLVEKDEQHREGRSLSPHSPVMLEITSVSQEPKAASNRTDPLADFLVGDRVLVSGVQPGTLLFKGETHFAEGVWAGVELDKSEGNNDGAHGNKRYFTCPYPYGIFAPPHKISHLIAEDKDPPETEGYIFTDEKYPEQNNEVDGYPGQTFEEAPQNKALDNRTIGIERFEVLELQIKATDETIVDSEVDVLAQTTAAKEETPIQAEPSPLDVLKKDEPPLTTTRVQEPELNSLSENLLKFCLKDTVTCLQSIRKQRAAKIQQSNLDLLNVATSSDVHALDDKPEKDTHIKHVPAFDATSRQNLEEFEPSHNLLTVVGEEPDWFDEDFGLSSRKDQKEELEKGTSAELTPEPCLVVPLPEPAPKPILPTPQPEPPMAVPHTVPEVEQLVQMAADDLWRWKQLGGDLQTIRASYTETVGNDQNPAVCAYKAVIFDLTLQIFDEICSPDPRGSQPPWKKPPRVSPLYARRVRDPKNLEEVKSFLIDEVLSLLSLKKTQNHKTDWQRMMKFGRKKRDRVDHILVQELHEEEAQWVNYDEDELFVKMQLADGIFDALIRDTVQVLQRIQEKKNHPLLV